MKKTTIGELKTWMDILNDKTVVYLETEMTENQFKRNETALQDEKNPFMPKRQRTNVNEENSWFEEKKEKNPFEPVPQGPRPRKEKKWWE